MKTGKSFVRRDKLLEIEAKVRVSWEQFSMFKAESNVTRPEPREKFVAFPYMNGVLHLGHAFSLSKLEFVLAYHRLRGVNVLLPFAFHCTEMPIKASADKFVREVHRFGDSLVFPTLMEEDEIEDLKAFGFGCDWRHTFITTDINPFYNSFVRWKMRKLKDMGKIVKDLKYTVYSPLDGQPCVDRDRASGEGMQPQDYTLIKMETNSWVLPDGKYGGFEINETDVFIIAKRAALNLVYQKLSKIPEKPTYLITVTGHDLIGLPLKSPMSFNEIIYSLPMFTILTDKAFRAKFGVKDEWVLPFEVIPNINIPEFGDKAAKKVCIDLKIKNQNEKDKLAEAKRLTYLK
ncbi:hypothetical protein GIB67_009816 [Kingdonia uniflora]|uniref:leucine--tRNA ligase n=1 Tax=Kingdonia uniflora TaxID=39325 RepID=A0A7J7MGV9_9MAGN|nr:hypothetical protein GIB67_009816 [Kingdonia uniflora]